MFSLRICGNMATNPLLLFKHTFSKLFFSQHHLPMLLVAAHIGQRVVAIHVDDVIVGIAGAEVHLVEEIA